MENYRLVFGTMCIVLFARINYAFGSNWEYPDLEKNEEFPAWGGICDNGMYQSPINLNKSTALRGIYEVIKFENYDKMQSGITIVNNGHTIQLSKFSHQMYISGGPLLGKYKLEQIHLHWWSEHTFDNVRYPLEVHIVHSNMRYANITMAANYKDGIAVIGILYHGSKTPNKGIGDIIINLDQVRSKEMVNQPVIMENNFAVSDLINGIDGYMTYAGSLTTPSCSEAVTWIISSQTFPVTLLQVDKLREVETADGKFLKNNFRFIQSTNNRPIITASTHTHSNGKLKRLSSFHLIILTLICNRILSNYINY